jgi:hypothetical protein
MISGKSFANACRWVLDPRYPEREPFVYSRAQHGDWVFVNGDYLDEVRRRIPAVFTKRFTFVIHNSDRPFDESALSMIVRYSLHIYAINTTVSHPRLTTIPLGFVDRQLPFLESFQRPNVPRDIDIYANFTQTTNDAKRAACIEAFKNDPRVTWRSGLSVEDYYTDLCRSTFVLCPEGTGIDTHRVYEALFCGATPVVLRNSLSHLYSKLSVCSVDTWADSYIVSNQPFHTDISFFLGSPQSTCHVHSR